jgi:hypothetical protein
LGSVTEKEATCGFPVSETVPEIGAFGSVASIELLDDPPQPVNNNVTRQPTTAEVKSLYKPPPLNLIVSVLDVQVGAARGSVPQTMGLLVSGIEQIWFLSTDKQAIRYPGRLRVARIISELCDRLPKMRRTAKAALL